MSSMLPVFYYDRLTPLLNYTCTHAQGKQWRGTYSISPVFHVLHKICTQKNKQLLLWIRQHN